MIVYMFTSCSHDLRGMAIILAGGAIPGADLSGVSGVFKTVRLKRPPEEYQP